MRTLVLLTVLAVAASGQRHKMEAVDAEKPDGKLLQQALQEDEPAKKAALLETFAREFPQSPDLVWALEQMQGAYAKAGDNAKTISAGERLLAIDPGDPEAALQNLKAAGPAKDAAAIAKWSAVASANARKVAAAPQPAESDQVENWKAEVDYAKQVDQYSGYALYRAAVESRDAKAVVALVEQLRQQDPKSEYIPKSEGDLFLAYTQTGAAGKALALAETSIAAGVANEDMLLFVIDNYSKAQKEPAKIHAYAAKLVEILASKPKPEGADDANWEARKRLITGLAHYMSGAQYARESKHAETDKEMRAALPLVGTNPAVKAEVLFDLGFANYKMEKPQEAADFYRECASMKSPFQATAAKNLQGVKTQYHGIK